MYADASKAEEVKNLNRLHYFAPGSRQAWNLNYKALPFDNSIQAPSVRIAILAIKHYVLNLALPDHYMKDF